MMKYIFEVLKHSTLSLCWNVDKHSAGISFNTEKIYRDCQRNVDQGSSVWRYIDFRTSGGLESIPFWIKYFDIERDYAELE